MEGPSTAFKLGFLFGLYDEDGPRTEDELKKHIPFPENSEDYKEWLKGYYENLR